MNTERIDRLKQLMDEQQFDALLLSLPGHIVLASGFWPLNNGLAGFILPREGRPLCIVPHCEAQEAAVDLWDADLEQIKFGVLDGPDYGVEFGRKVANFVKHRNIKRIGIDLGTESFAPASNAAEITLLHGYRRAGLEHIFGKDAVMDVSSAFAEQKLVKNAFEIDRIRRANEIARMGLDLFVKMVSVGRSGLELRSAVETIINVEGTGYQGARRVRAFAQVSTGPEETRWGFRPMVDTTARRLNSGDIALLEMAVVVDGYWADRTVPVIAGKSSMKQDEVCALIQRAQAAVISGLRPGMTCEAVDRLARDIINAAGYEKEFLHITGHGIGFQYHDPAPFLMPGNQSALPEGTVVTVEPGVYWEGFGGIRFEENVVVTKQGGEALGKLE